MEYANCSRCGKMFMRLSSPVCPDCQKEDEEMFQKIRDYLDKNPTNTMAQVSEATGASIKRILKYIREGRLEMSPGIAAAEALKCIKCGKPILGGNMCLECQNMFGKAAQQIISDRNKPKINMGMHSIPRKTDDLKK